MLNAEILREAEQRRLAWRCRRGMLELDIVLQRFVSHHFDGLTLAEMAHFDVMLELPDNHFWDLIQEVSSPSLLAKSGLRPMDADQQSVLNKLRASRALSAPVDVQRVPAELEH